ncbi:recombinase family protein [Halalkalibacter krulwichiae]|uniref:DNA-invertase hin n=1 Tax=Halalkalibacter krulwichiae TaxID=199441 RepID=A0A1X9MFJ0_9BACI|nr:recombinase family protein [Halalkalibacter krulwichiae]ARK32186.1 DNA-invertase hin [Halalkalibacter krulwichiae]
MKAAIYIRVSTQEQVENYSIESQRERLEAFCKAKGWTIYNTYIDGGYSGANTDRPALQEMLSNLSEFKAVVVYKLDRLSRSQRDTLDLIEEHFLKNDVDFVSVTETLDTSTPFGKAMIGILSVFAQLERETIAERMRMGHIKRAQEGLRGMGGNHDPSGYIRKNGVLEINDKEARHIQLVYDLYERYHSITKVQEYLKSIGEPVWRFRRYRDILSNRLYIGEVSFAGKFYKGLHDSIISKDQFERVQSLLSRHKGFNANKAKASLLSGLITCGECGEPYMTYQSTDKTKRGPVKYRYYTCRARRFPSEYDKKCMNKTWNQKKLDVLIKSEIKKLSLNKQYDKKEKELINYDLLIKRTDEKIERLIALYAEGKFNVELLEKQVNNLNSEKEELLNKKNKQEMDTTSEFSSRKLNQYAIILENAEFKECQAVIQKLIDNIIIEGESIRIDWVF